MIRVRNYGFPGFFSEANPESSTRNTGTKHPRRIWFAPGYVGQMIARARFAVDIARAVDRVRMARNIHRSLAIGRRAPDRPRRQTSSSSLRIWNARTMSVTPCIRAQIPAKTRST